MLGDAKNNIIFANVVAWNKGTGIHLHNESNDNKISKNLVSDNKIGILLFYLIEYKLSPGHNNEIVENTIQWNSDYGLRLESATGNQIYHNNVIENGTNGWDNGTNQYDDGSSLGNYWSDYWWWGGRDANGDGIGDSPYYIQGGNNRDNYPKMEPFF